MELIKEFFGAIGGRLRSHFIGSILISFLVFNWDSVLFLLTDGNSTLMKIAYTKQNWEYLRPLTLGLLLGFVNPWVVFGGALLAKFPSEKLHSLQDDTKHKRAMQLLENEATENDKKAELAKSKDDALKTIDDEDIRDSLKEETAPSNKPEENTGKNALQIYAEKHSISGRSTLPDDMSEFERGIIRRMGKRKGILLTIVQDSELSNPVQIDGQAAPKGSPDEYNLAMSKLDAYGIVENKIPHANKVSVFELTDFGRSLFPNSGSLF